MNHNRTENLTDKPLRKFQPGDTLYVRKMRNGFSLHYFCRFAKIERGTIHVEPISCEQAHEEIPATMTTRASNCYLWGRRRDERWATCQWFSSLDLPAGIKQAKEAA